MDKLDTRKILFSLSGIALVTLLSLFIQNYVHAFPKEGKKFGDWVVACEKDTKNKKTCFLVQTMTTNIGDNKNQHFATFRLGSTPKSADLIFTQILPFGTSLRHGTSIILSGEKMVSPGVFTTCQNFGCIAMSKITKKDFNEIVKAKEAFLGVMSIEGKQLNINLSTKGLKDGVEALSLFPVEAKKPATSKATK